MSLYDDYKRVEELFEKSRYMNKLFWGMDSALTKRQMDGFRRRGTDINKVLMASRRNYLIEIRKENDFTKEELDFVYSYVVFPHDTPILEAIGTNATFDKIAEVYNLEALGFSKVLILKRIRNEMIIRKIENLKQEQASIKVR